MSGGRNRHIPLAGPAAHTDRQLGVRIEAMMEGTMETAIPVPTVANSTSELLTLGPDPAAAMCTEVTVAFATAPPSGCYMSGVYNMNINSTLLRKDCNVTTCMTWLQANKVTRAATPNRNCYMYDMVTKEAFPLSDLVTFCFPKTTAAITLAPTTTTVTANPTPTPTIDSSSNSTVAVGGAIGGVLALAFLVVLGWWCRRRRADHADTTTFNKVGSPRVSKPASFGDGGKSRNIITKASSSSSSTGGLSNDSIVTQGILADMQQLELHRIPYADVHMVQSVAEGAFGQVWLGSFMGHQVAVKKLLPRKSTAEDLAQFIKEILLVSKFECPYVVSFVGAAWHKPVDMVLVTEFMDRGDLRGVLQANAAKDPADKTFTWRDKVECALSVAEGLVYLHSMDPVVIHRDLKSRNVLVDSTRGCKITDFGIARETYDQTLTLNAGTYRWMAPEVVQDGYYSQSADLFSFGVILSELDTEQLPYANQRNDRGNPFTDLRLMEAVAKGRILPAFTAACPAWFQELGVQCMALDPTQRPSAIQVSFVIRGHLENLSTASDP